jgi:carboxylate-amine ligase
VYLVNSFNRFEASRYGLRGELIDPWTGAKRRIGEDILNEIAFVAPHAATQGAGGLLAELAEFVRRGQSEADWLRESAARGGALADVVRDAVRLWSEG